MQIREFSKPLTAAKLIESLAQRFGSKINIDAFTTEQLQDARNKLRTRVFNVETTESFDAVQNKEYTKSPCSGSQSLRLLVDGSRGFSTQSDSALDLD